MLVPFTPMNPLLKDTLISVCANALAAIVKKRRTKNPVFLNLTKPKVLFKSPWLGL